MHGEPTGGRATMPAVVGAGAGVLVAQPLLKKQVGGATSALCAKAEHAGLAAQMARQSAGVAAAWLPMSPPVQSVAGSSEQFSELLLVSGGTAAASSSSWRV